MLEILVLFVGENPFCSNEEVLIDHLYLSLFSLHRSIPWTGRILPLRTNETQQFTSRKCKCSEIVEAAGLLVDRHTCLVVKLDLLTGRVDFCEAGWCNVCVVVVVLVVRFRP